MKKIVFVFALIIGFTATESHAQVKLGMEGGVAFPFIDFGDLVDIGYGANASAKFFVTRNIAFGANVGYYYFPGTEFDFGLGLGGVEVAPDVEIIPLTGSVDFFFISDDGLRGQIGVEAGAYFDKRGGAPVTNFGFAPVVGSGYAFGENFELFANAKAHIIVDKEAFEDDFEEDFPTTTFLTVSVGARIVF